MGSKRVSENNTNRGFSDLPKGGKGLPAPTATPRMGISQSVTSAAMVEAVLNDPRWEAYAQAVAEGASYSAAYRQSGFAHDTSNAHKLAVVPEVAARIRMLKVAAAERRVCSIASRMALLDDMIHASPEELTRVVVQPCGACWESDQTIAAAAGAASAVGKPWPSTDAPRSDCQACHGEGISRVVLTPTDQLSAGARALFKSASQDKHGVITVQTHDRLAAIAELNKMQDGALAATRSMSLNVNSYIPAARDPVSIEELNRLFDAFDDDAKPFPSLDELAARKVVAEG